MLATAPQSPNTGFHHVLIAANAVVTVHGTVALEAAARGIPVILSDRSYFSDWDIAHVARDRKDYLHLLGKVAHLSPPDAAARARAQACFALALAEPPTENAALRMSCDSSGSMLYDEIYDRYHRDQAGIRREVARITAFLGQSNFDSYAAFHFIEWAKQRVSAQQGATAA